MARNAGRSYAEQWQAIANDYFTGTARHTATSREIAAWAIKHGKWKPSPMLLLNKATEDVARAMREEYAIDPQGRRARVKHAARESRMAFSRFCGPTLATRRFRGAT